MELEHIRQFCANTPTISILDNRGIAVRTLRYNRNQGTQQEPYELITRMEYTLSGNAKNIVDPRLSALQNDVLGIFNFECITSLTGTLLCSDCVDSGKIYQLTDVEGKLLWTRNANQLEKRIEYDELGRPTALYESDNEATRCVQRWVYGENVPSAEGYNLKGNLTAIFDEAGLLHTPSRSIQGDVLMEVRRFRENTSEPVNWQGDQQSQWEELISPQEYRSIWQYDQSSHIISQTDAEGNTSFTRRDSLGRITSTSIRLLGSAEQLILKHSRYNAAGQILEEELSNSAVNNYEYEPETQRLLRSTTIRTDSNGSSQVRDIVYEYDAVGNIISQLNRANAGNEPKPKCEYQYDALYQLIEATGCEIGLSRQNDTGESTYSGKEPWSIYKRSYQYDTGGNLIQIYHEGISPFTRNITVSQKSNRAISLEGAPQKEVDQYFDPSGNLLELRDGVQLDWNGNNQLQAALLNVRADGSRDSEHYLYQTNGQRVIKMTEQLVNKDMVSTEVKYLPGIEYHRSATKNKVIEDYQIIIFGSGLRIIHWSDGFVPEGLANDMFRYCLTDQVRSVSFELDDRAEILSQEEYYPYGETAIRIKQDAAKNDYNNQRYSGKELDATGLYYFGFRYYIPWIGRWLSPDPAGFVDGINLYRMVRNNPITNFDLSGLAPTQRPRTRLQQKYRSANALMAHVKHVRNSLFELRRDYRRGLITSAQHRSALTFMAVSKFKGGATKWRNGSPTAGGEPAFYFGRALGAYDYAVNLSLHTNKRISTGNRADINEANVLNLTKGGSWANESLPGSYVKLTQEHLDQGYDFALNKALSPLRQELGQMQQQLSQVQGREASANMQRAALSNNIEITENSIRRVTERLQGYYSTENPNERIVPIGKNASGPFWDILSAQFAYHAALSGTASASYPEFGMATTFYHTTVFNRVEQPIMQAGDTDIATHVISPGYEQDLTHAWTESDV